MKLKLKVILMGLSLAALAAPRDASAAVTVQGWWHFNNAAAPLVDSSGSNHNYGANFSFRPGGPAIAPANSFEGVGGPLGTTGTVNTNSLRFGLLGTQSSFWNTGYNPPPTNYGLEMWFLPQNNGVVGGSSTWVFSTGGSQVALPSGGAWGGETLRLFPNFDGTVTLTPGIITGNDSTSVANFSGSGTADTNHWIHLALLNFNGLIAFYTNGVLCSTNDTGATYSPPAGAMYIGTDGDNQAIDGYIAEERVFTFASGAFTTNDLLLRLPGPAVVIQPKNTTVWNGGAANFSAKVSIDPADTFQWQRSGTNISGATSANYNFDPANLVDTASIFDCAITNGGIGNIGSNATLTVVSINSANVQAYTNAVATDPNVIAYFPNDNNTGPTVVNVLDASHDGTLEGLAVRDSQTNRAFGQRSVLLAENGDVQIQANSAYEFGNGFGTVEALIYLTPGTPTGYNPTIFSVAASDGTAVRYQLEATPDGNNLIYANDSPVQLTFAVPVNLLNRFAHVAFTIDHDTNVTAYVDGLSLGTKSQTNFGTGVGVPAFIGSASTNLPGLWSGTLDDVAIYKTNLSASTIAIHNSLFLFGTNTSGPGIASQSASASLYAGGSPVLTVTATGTPPLSYQWSTNGTPISGATQSTLALVNTTVASSATYTVAVNNPIGPVTNSQAIVMSFSAPPAGYASVIMADHPSAYWRMNDTSGTTLQDFAGGLNGTYIGAVINYNVPGAILGDSDSAVNFPGTNTTHGQVPFSPVLNPATAYTLEFWAKPNNNGAQIIMGSQFRTGTPRDGFAMNVHNGGTGWTVQMGNQTGVTIQIIGNQPVPAGSWSHFAMVWDGTTAHLYTLGEADGTATGGYLPNFVNPWVIGERNDGAGLFNGAVDEVAFYNYALTQSQIQGHVDIGLPLMVATTASTNIIADTQPVNGPFDGINNNTPWAASVSDGTKTLNGVMAFNTTNNNQITLPGYTAFAPTTNAPMTIMFWMKSAGTTGAGSEGAILYNWRPPNGAGGVAFIQHDGGTFFVQAMNNYNHFDSVGNISDNKWHHCAVICNPDISGGVDLYIDGTLDSSIPNLNAWFWPTGRTVEFGRDSLYDGGYWRNFNGAMDDIRIYNRALTPSEISSIVTSGVLVDNSALVLRYAFDGPPNGWTVTWPYGFLQAAPSVPALGSFTTLPVASPFPIAQHPGTMRFFRALQ